MKDLYLALVHHPIKNKNDELVTTSVTNLDIHDISRSCKTFGVKNYFIVTPISKQKELVSKILGHWDSDEASDYNPDRQDALSDTRVLSSVKSCIDRISLECGQKPVVIATGANFKSYLGGEEVLKAKLSSIDNPPSLLIFGTGWGLHSDLDELIDFRLEPIFGTNSSYNHLSVRSAVAIYLDRLTREV
jgi:hypothetical protein